MLRLLSRRVQPLQAPCRFSTSVIAESLPSKNKKPSAERNPLPFKAKSEYIVTPSNQTKSFAQKSDAIPSNKTTKTYSKIDRSFPAKNLKSIKDSFNPLKNDWKESDSYQLTQRVTELCRQKQLEAAIALVEQTTANGSANVVVWNNLIAQVLNAKQYILAFSLWKNMKRRGITPNSRSYTSFFTGYQRSLERAYDRVAFTSNLRVVFAQWKKHLEDNIKSKNKEEVNDIPLNAYIDVLGKLKKYDEIIEIHSYFHDFPVQIPTYQTYSMIINAFRPALRPESIGFETSKYSVEQEGYLRTIKMLWEEVQKIAPEKIDSFLVSHMMSILKVSPRNEDKRMALQIAEKYLGFRLKEEDEPEIGSAKVQIPADSASVSITLATAIALKDWDLTWNLFNQVRDYPKVFGKKTLVYQHYDLALVALCHKKDIRSTKVLIEGLLKSKAPINASTWYRAFEVMWKSQNMSESFALYSLMTGLELPPSHSRTSLASPPKADSPTNINSENKGDKKIQKVKVPQHGEVDLRIATTLLQTALATRNRGTIDRVLTLLNTQTNFGLTYMERLVSGKTDQYEVVNDAAITTVWKTRYIVNIEGAIDYILIHDTSFYSPGELATLEKWREEAKACREKLRKSESVLASYKGQSNMSDLGEERGNSKLKDKLDRWKGRDTKFQKAMKTRPQISKVSEFFPRNEETMWKRRSIIQASQEPPEEIESEAPRIINPYQEDLMGKKVYRTHSPNPNQSGKTFGSHRSGNQRNAKIRQIQKRNRKNYEA